MDIINTIILGIIQGIAEFLPISSSAHLIIFRDLFGIGAEQYIVLLLIVILSFFIYNFGMGMFHTIIDKYLRNFSNEKIDTKIFAAYNLFRSVFRMLAGLLASFLLDKMATTYCMIIIGILFTIIYILLGKYMKTRVGLKPEEYSDEERKYDELNQVKE